MQRSAFSRFRCTEQGTAEQTQAYFLLPFDSKMKFPFLSFFFFFFFFFFDV